MSKNVKQNLDPVLHIFCVFVKLFLRNNIFSINVLINEK